VSATALAPLAIALPLAMAAVLAVLGPRVPRVAVDLIAAATALAVIVAAGALVAATGAGRQVTWAGGWTPSQGFSVGVVLVVDRAGAALALLVGVLVLAAVTYAWRYFEIVHGNFQVLVLAFLGAMCGFALSGDLFDMFVFFELMGAVAYALTGYRIEEPGPLQGALNFGIVNSLGAYAMLTGIGLLYGRTSELGLAQLGVALAGHRADPLVVAAFVLVATGFLVKAAMVPFHFWLPDAHAVAPTPVCILFSGVMVELGVYGVARVYWTVFSATLPAASVQRALLVLGTVTALVGAALCVLQRHLKRLLAYSTVSHVGLFLLGVGVLTRHGLAGTMLYVLGHAGVKAALFLCVGVLLNRYGSVDERSLHGRGRPERLVGVAFVLGGLALAGLPPFGTWAGKAVLEEALANAGYPLGPVLPLVVSALTGAAVLRAGLGVFWGLGRPPGHPLGHPALETSGENEEPESDRPVAAVPWSMVGPVLGLLVGSLAVGALPQLAPAASRAATEFVDRAGYAGQALAGAASTDRPGPALTVWSASSVGLGLLAVAIAAGLALAHLYRDRLPAAGRATARRVLRPGRALLVGLARLQSGHVGDYVAWLAAGVVVLAALVGPAG